MCLRVWCKRVLPCTNSTLTPPPLPSSSVQSFVDHPASYPSVSAASASTDALYETMAMTQSNTNQVYSPPLATSLGKSCLGTLSLLPSFRLIFLVFLLGSFSSLCFFVTTFG